MGRDNIAPFFCFKILCWGECCKGGKSRSEDPAAPIRNRMLGSSGFSLIFGGKGQCAALWDLPKIITNTQNQLEKSKLYTSERKYKQRKINYMYNNKMKQICHTIN